MDRPIKHLPRQPIHTPLQRNEFLPINHMRNPTPATFTEKTLLLSTLKCRAGPDVDVFLCRGGKFEHWEHQGDAVGGCGLEATFGAVTDVDFEWFGEGCGEGYGATLAVSLHF